VKASAADINELPRHDKGQDPLILRHSGYWLGKDGATEGKQQGGREG
jgi:hypothetical protein